MQQEYLAGETVETIYFGGGTPSLLLPEEIRALLETLHRTFPISPNAEITLEANPDDLNASSLESLHAAGVNRLSIGVQSFFEDDLRWMNRAHDATQALDCIQLAKAAGFDNISIDLIYGGPTLTDAHWQQNVEQAVVLGVPHLSCYALTVEPGTALDHFIRRKKIPAIDPDKAAVHFEMLMQWLEAAGYEHYEISNFSLPGRRSRHNSSYWQGKSYLGLGPSAHSFNGNSRQWNVANNALYLQGIRKGSIPFEKEVLSPQMALNEYIMISLRTAAGCNLERVSLKFGQEKSLQLLAAGREFIEKGWMQQEDTMLRLTHEGKFFADGIAAAMFF